MIYALETQDLCKSFGGLRVTQSVNLKLERGARHALIGPNGAGKTTLINLLSGSLRASSGAIRIHGQDITHLPPHERVRRGLSRTFQLNQLFPRMTVIEAVMLAAAQSERSAWWTRLLVPLAARCRAGEVASEVIERVGLTAAAHKKIDELPYGRQRVVEIALALAARPQVLLLDEPAAGIPEGESEEIIATLASLPDSVTLLLIEHDMDLVFRFARRISVLVSGALLAEGSPDEVAADPVVQSVYLGRKAHA